MLTATDVDNIVGNNFAPNIKKLADELGAHWNDPPALYAISTRIVAQYGRQVASKVAQRAEVIYGGGCIPVGMPGLHWTAICGGRKKTTKAEAIARQIDALVKLLQEEPDGIVGPILDHLLKRINWKRFERVVKKLREAGYER
jgi:hypothetical protein